MQKIYGLYGLKHHIVEMRGGVTDAGRTTTNDERQTVKIELLSQWNLEAEFRNIISDGSSTVVKKVDWVWDGMDMDGWRGANVKYICENLGHMSY